MYSLQIEGTPDQGPFAFDLLQSTEQKLPDAQHFLDDAEDWLGRPFSPPVEVFALSGLKTVGHRLQAAFFVGRLSGIGEAFPPGLAQASRGRG